MKLAQNITQRQQAGLKLSQELHRAIGFLELSNLDLARHLDDVAGDNPCLRLYLPRTHGDLAVEVASPGPSLIGHILERLPFLVPKDGDRQIAAHFIDALEPSGFLGLSAEEIAAQAGCSEAQAERVLGALQQIEPSGLFARSLGECLALQMSAAGEPPEPAMRRLLAALPAFASGGLAGLARACGLSEQDAAVMMTRLRLLNPRPAAGFFFDPAPTRVADLIFEPDGGDWVARLNPETLPRLSLIEAGPIDRGSRSARAYRAARGVIAALERRNAALLAVGQVLAREQAGFLRSGPGALRPLTKRAVAAEIGMHESSVGRMVNAGSAETPMGTVALNRFFCRAARLTGEMRPKLGAPAIARRIAQMIAAEAPARPMSDGQIADALSAEGVTVSRRVVARLRTEAGIGNRTFRRHPSVPR